MSAPQAIDCERGFHAPLVAHEPIISLTHVEVDHVCPACGAIEYTTSYTRAAWDETVEKQAQKQAKAASARTGG